ncbi:MAG: large repetitive protein, partial [Frankiaceae bacterium]|nr:large repetitive protein [Frankiaceae bacterium]
MRRGCAACAVVLGTSWLLAPSAGAVVPPTFTTATYAVGASPSDVEVGDLDHDGALDIVSANRGAGTVSVLLGDGHGAFAPATTFPAGSQPSGLALTDVDGNGALDVAVANSSGGVRVLRGNGAGGLSAPVAYAAGLLATAIASGDLDGDGAPDLAVASSGSNLVSVLRNSGAGAFSGPTSTSVPGGPAALAIRDLDGDGARDVVTANGASSRMNVLRGDGAGGLAAPVAFADGGGNDAIDLGDLNGDGVPDVVTAGGDGLAVLIGDGAGGFAAPAVTPADYASGAVTVADFNADHLADAALTNLNGVVNVFPGDGHGNLIAPIVAATPTGSYPAAATAGDFDADGKTDLVTANKNDNTLSVLHNDTNTNTALFVAPGGADTGACATPTTPCATLTYALGQAASTATINVSGTLHERVTIAKPVTISGAAAPAGSPAVIDGDAGGTVVTVHTASPVFLEDLTIQDGAGTRGGGVNNITGSLTLTDVVVRDNTATDYGGGILQDANATLTLIRTTVTGNTLSEVGPQGGGGIGFGRAGANSGRLVLTESTISNNHSESSGGGIYLDSGTLTATRSTISGNTATNSSYNTPGGGVFSNGSTIFIDSTLSANAATDGGALFNRYSGNATFVESTIAGNSAERWGGGIFNQDDGTGQGGKATLTATLLADNTAGNSGANCYQLPVTSLGYNLSDGAADAACGFTQPTDMVGADPALGPLADN